MGKPHNKRDERTADDSEPRLDAEVIKDLDPPSDDLGDVRGGGLVQYHTKPACEPAQTDTCAGPGLCGSRGCQPVNSELCNLTV
jgi:hypothetical protein